jgi:RNA polymerase sigma-70 factor (ECF subfamily)
VTPAADRPENAPAAPEYAASALQAETTRLMTAAKHGDREAFDRLATQVRASAYRVAQGLVGSRDDALELSQEALLKVYRARESYRDGEPFLPWFQRIVRNTCYSFLRQKSKLAARSMHARSEKDSGEWQLADEDAPMPDDASVRGERAAAFWRAFGKLSARDREMLALRHFRDLSYQEIADHLAIPVGTVMSRLFHARRRLREGLGGALDEPVTEERA